MVVKIGKDENSWALPQKLLSFHSSYFKAAMLGTFKEGRSGNIHLVHEEMSILELFGTWLYNGKCLDEEEDGSDGFDPEPVGQ